MIIGWCIFEIQGIVEQTVNDKNTRCFSCN